MLSRLAWPSRLRACHQCHAPFTNVKEHLQWPWQSHCLDSNTYCDPHATIMTHHPNWSFPLLKPCGECFTTGMAEGEVNYSEVIALANLSETKSYHILVDLWIWGAEIRGRQSGAIRSRLTRSAYGLNQCRQCDLTPPFPFPLSPG